MTKDASKIDAYLRELRSSWRSHPPNWHEFFEYLRSFKKAGQKDPPVPLILSAYGESPARKYARLAEQLDWALSNSCLDQALAFLKRRPGAEWEFSSEARWDRDLN